VGMARGRRLRDFAEVLSLFTSAELAAALGTKINAASNMRARGRIEARYWLPLIAAVNERGCYVLTPEMLCEWAHKRGPKPSLNRRQRSPRRSPVATTGPPP